MPTALCRGKGQALSFSTARNGSQQQQLTSNISRENLLPAAELLGQRQERAAAGRRPLLAHFTASIMQKINHSLENDNNNSKSTQPQSWGALTGGAQDAPGAAGHRAAIGQEPFSCSGFKGTHPPPTSTGLPGGGGGPASAGASGRARGSRGQAGEQGFAFGTLPTLQTAGVRCGVGGTASSGAPSPGAGGDTPPCQVSCSEHGGPEGASKAAELSSSPGSWVAVTRCKSPTAHGLGHPTNGGGGVCARVLLPPEREREKWLRPADAHSEHGGARWGYPGLKPQSLGMGCSRPAPAHISEALHRPCPSEDAPFWGCSNPSPQPALQ